MQEECPFWGMNEEDAFLRAILAAPGDASPRLVYADWLEERGDPRGGYLRLLTELDGLDDTDPRVGDLCARLQIMRQGIDPMWTAQMNRGRARDRGGKSVGESSPRVERRRSRREVLEADIGIFLRKYARKSQKTYDPNDRHYDRRIEQLVKRMRPEDLDRLIRGEDD
jgi:uncharacterized protein (TIGR02996 family)